jgi:threonine synthase
VLRSDVAAGKLGRDDTIVCILTGTGFKDSNAVQAMSEGVEIPVIALEDLAKHL